jgi:hypothetical protein
VETTPGEIVAVVVAGLCVLGRLASHLYDWWEFAQWARFGGRVDR